MTRIDCNLNLRYIDGRRYLITDDFIVDTDTVGLITVPAGETTDFNSTPRALWSIMPPQDYAEAGVAHDFLYTTGVRVVVDGGTGAQRHEPITRAEADATHRELLIYRGCPRWKVEAMYWGLRVGGWRVWNTYRAQDATRLKVAAFQLARARTSGNGNQT